jgi:hypothetical protein
MLSIWLKGGSCASFYPDFTILGREAVGSCVSFYPGFTILGSVEGPRAVVVARLSHDNGGRSAATRRVAERSGAILQCWMIGCKN